MPLVGRPIAPGDTIGIVAPATPAPRRAEVERGIAWWEAHGYRVELGPSMRERGRDFAGSPELRARDLQEMFANPEIAAIQCVRGGYGSAEVVPLLDYEAIARTPKAFVGFSDITALHAALWRHAELATFYGPGLVGLGVRPLPVLTAERLLAVLTGDGTGPVPYDPDGPYVRAVAGGTASGRLAGGFLADLVHTFGTPWEIETDGAILFFENFAFGGSWTDRLLVHFHQAGKLRGVAGIVVGELPHSAWGDDPIGPAWPRSREIDDVLDERLGGLGVPVLFGLPCGHGETMLTLPLGVEATVDADALELRIDEPALQ